MNNIFQTPIYLRLTRYKDIKHQVSIFVDWMDRNESTLIESWRSYCLQIRFLTYLQYCEFVYANNLPHVNPKSYKKLLK